MSSFALFSSLQCRERNRLLLRWLLLGGAYLGAAHIGLLLAPKELAISLIWLPTGIAAAAFYRWGSGYWPVIFLAATLLQESSFDVPWPAAGWIVAGQTLGPLAVAWLLRRFGFHPEFDRQRDIFLFCGVGCVAMLLPASFGVSTLCFTGQMLWSGFFTAWMHWWLGDWMGVLIAGPLLISISRRSWEHLLGRHLEFFGWCMLSAGIMGTVFFLPARSSVAELSLIFIPLGLTVWAAMRLGVTGTSLGVMALALLAAYGTAIGRGPFFQPMVHEGVLLLWAYLIAATAFNLMVTGIEIDRSAKERDLVASRHSLEEMNAALEEAASHAQSMASRAEATADAKGRFLLNMSHEIRTPLNGVLAMSELLCNAPLTREQQGYAKVVHDCGEGLLRLTNDILDFSRMEAGKLRVEKVLFDLEATLRQVTGWLGLEAGRKGVGFFIEMAPEVPRQLCGDPGRLGQVVVNLVHNAVKFTSRGEITLSVSVSERSREECLLRFGVRDTGSGISQEWLGRIFEPFAQVEGNAAYPTGSSGLGLAICRQIAELMGGKIGVISTVGEGSVFWFTAKFDLVQETGEGCPTEGEPSVSQGITGRVLLVEDNRVNQRIGTILLQKIGMEVDVCGNGLEALESLKGRRYDLLLMDCHMPEMDGFEATRLIRASGKETLPIIAMTADALEETRSLCMAAGMNDYLVKPVREKELAEVIRRWLKGQGG